MLPRKFASRLFGCCGVEFRSHIEAMSYEEVLFIDDCFALDQSGSFVCFEIGQSDSFKCTDQHTANIPFLYIRKILLKDKD